MWNGIKWSPFDPFESYVFKRNMFCQFERFEKRLVNLNQIVDTGHVCFALEPLSKLFSCDMHVPIDHFGDFDASGNMCSLIGKLGQTWWDVKYINNTQNMEIFRPFNR